MSSSQIRDINIRLHGLWLLLERVISQDFPGKKSCFPDVPCTVFWWFAGDGCNNNIHLSTCWHFVWLCILDPCALVCRPLRSLSCNSLTCICLAICLLSPNTFFEQKIAGCWGDVFKMFLSSPESVGWESLGKKVYLLTKTNSRVSCMFRTTYEYSQSNIQL